MFHEAAMAGTALPDDKGNTVVPAGSIVSRRVGPGAMGERRTCPGDHPAASDGVKLVCMSMLGWLVIVILVVLVLGGATIRIF